MAWEFIRSTYDTVAAKYEARFLDELDRKPRDRELLDAFSRAVTDPVVEIGCGPGQVGAYVRGSGRRVVGLDLSAAMARLATVRLDDAVVGDMRSLPFASRSVGGVVAFYSLIHMHREEMPVVLHEFRRVLRPGGRALLSAHEGTGEVELDRFVDEPVPFAVTLFGLDELVAACEAAGLKAGLAERRERYEGETTVRLYVEATHV